MKKYKKFYSAVILVLMLFIGNHLFAIQKPPTPDSGAYKTAADGDDLPPPVGLPIDGGILFLLSAGLIYGVRKTGVIANS